MGRTCKCVGADSAVSNVAEERGVVVHEECVSARGGVRVRVESPPSCVFDAWRGGVVDR